MKYKYLTKEQILLSLDRLTRFKNTREKYIRVFSDILVSNLIEPKLKKTDIENIDFEIITKYVTEIINESIECYISNSSHKNCNHINNYLKNYENSVFVNDNETQKLLNNNINYENAIKIIPNDSPVNLKWLKELSIIIDDTDYNEILIHNRNNKKLKFPVEEVILVEGITEEILLPAFSKYLGYDFYSKGIQIIPAGGKNQVVKLYYKLAEELKLPIFILLDKDAEDNINQIIPRLRNIDRVHLVSCGEFEDLLPKSLIVKTVNTLFENFLTITEADLSENLPTAKILDEIFKTKGLQEFKKAEFAKLIRESIQDDSDVSSEIIAIVDEIRNNI